MDKKPLFILGNPRSGTSLYRLILTNHPEICIPPECGFIEWWHKKYAEWSAADAENGAKVAEYVEDVMSSRKIETWKLKAKELEALIHEMRPGNYAELSLIVILQYARQQGTDPVYLGDKNNYYVSHLDRLHKIFPDAKYLGIIRDGRDVACSYKSMKKVNTDSPYVPRLSDDISEIAEEWVLNNENIIELFEKVGEKNSFLIRYEDLLNSTEDILRQVCDFLNLPYSDHMLAYPEKNQKEHQEPDQFLAWKEKTLQLPDPSNIGKYKKQLSREEILLFEQNAEKLMPRFNYD